MPTHLTFGRLVILIIIFGDKLFLQIMNPSFVGTFHPTFLSFASKSPYDPMSNTLMLCKRTLKKYVQVESKNHTTLNMNTQWLSIFSIST